MITTSLLLALSSTQTGLIGVAIGAVVSGLPAAVAWRKSRSEIQNNEASASQTIMGMATEQLKNWQKDVEGLRSEIAELRHQHAAEIAELRKQHAAEIAALRQQHAQEMHDLRESQRVMEQRVTTVLNENHDLRSELAVYRGTGQ